MEENELLTTSPRPPLFKSALESGLVIAAILTVYSLLLYFIDLHLEQWLAYVAIVIMIVALYFAGNNYRKIGGRAAITYGKVFKFLLLTLLVISIASGIFHFVYFKWITPEAVVFIQNQAYEEMIGRGLSPKQAEKRMEMIIPWVMKPPSLAIIAALQYILWGLLASLIMAAMIKRETTSI